MTATMTPPVSAAASSTWTIGAPRLLAGLDQVDVLDHATHLAVHGPLPMPSRERLLDSTRQVSLAGRGGAGFPLATKLAALRSGRPVVLVNGSESEPASAKDRTLLRRSPHLVLDGALACAAALNAGRVIVAVHDDQAERSVRHALTQRPEGRGVEIHRVVGGFVAGEARAVIRTIDGGPALPPGRRVLPTEHGVGGVSTLVSNVETFAQLAVLLRIGPGRFASTGTHAEPGTVLLTLSGAVARPGVVEVPIGTPLDILLTAAGATSPQAVVIGGYHGGWHAPIGAIPLSRRGLRSAGGTLGAGVVAVLDSATCALGELARVTGWLASESAKQCGPCRFGLPTLARDVETLWSGHREGLEAALTHARAVTGRGACAHPDGAARFVASGLHLLQDEVAAHVHSGGCGRPVVGRLVTS